MAKNVTATFKTREAAETVLHQLEDAGVGENQISFVVTDETRGKTFNINEGSKVDEGFAAGATTGGIIGAVIGALATAGSIAIPGLNIVVTGALAGTLAGLGTGAAAGGLVGALVGLGIPEHEARLYENELKKGSILVSVACQTDEERDMVKNIIQGADSYNLAA